MGRTGQRPAARRQVLIHNQASENMQGKMLFLPFLSVKTMKIKILTVLAILSVVAAVAYAGTLRHYATGTTAAATSTFTPSGPVALYGYTFKQATAGTGNATLTLNSNKGATYDTVLDTRDASTDASYHKGFSPPVLIAPGDSLDWAWNNVAPTTWTIYLYLKPVHLEPILSV